MPIYCFKCMSRQNAFNGPFFHSDDDHRYFCGHCIFEMLDLDDAAKDGTLIFSNCLTATELSPGVVEVWDYDEFSIVPWIRRGVWYELDSVYATAQAKSLYAAK